MGPREDRQLGDKTDLCACGSGRGGARGVRERGEELARGVALKDETAETMNFKQQEGYSQTEGRAVSSMGKAWRVLSRIL